MRTEKSAASILKSAVPLSEYVSRFATAPVTRQGGSQKYRTACVVHGGDNVTGMIIDNKIGTWHCFTSDCGGGSIIDLWMGINNNKDLGECFEALATELGVTLPERDERSVSKKRMYNALDQISRACHEYFMTSKDEEARESRKYLKSRGISKRIAKEWLVGALPSGRRESEQFIKDSGADVEALIAAGFVNRNDGGSLWVPQSGRVLFPIMDRGGKVVGFGGRRVEGVVCSNPNSKYINTPESPIYRKSEVLYGMDFLDDNTKTVIVVEGYLDVIAFEDGITDESIVAVATCGTALTSGHASILSNYPRIVLSFDGDNAGDKAVIKSVPICNKITNSVECIRLPNGEDPCDLWQSGADMEELLDHSTTLISASVKAKWKMVESNPSEMSEWARSITPTLSYSRDRDEFLGDCARIIGKNPAMYKRELALPISISEKINSKSDVETVTPQARVLLSAILGMDEYDREGVLAGLRKWTDLTTSAVTNWLPLSTDFDVAVLRKMVLGVDDDSTSQVDREIGSLIPNGNDPINLQVILKGMSMQLLLGINDQNISDDYVIGMIPTLKKSHTYASHIPSQTSVLTMLIDMSVDMEKIVRRMQRDQEAAAS